MVASPVLDAPSSPARALSGMSFALTDEQEAIRRDGARIRRARDRASRQGVGRSADRFRARSMRKLGELGMLGVLVPEEYGGAGLTYIDYIHVIEELSRVDGSVGLSVAAHNSLCTNHLWLFGNEGQRRDVGDAARAGEAPRSLGPHGGRGGQRQRRDAHDGRPRRRHVGAERLEDVHHARLRRRRRGPHGGDGQGGGQARHLGVRRGPSPEGRPRGQEGEQARHAGVRHRDDRAGGLPDSEGQPPRRGGRRASFRR